MLRIIIILLHSVNSFIISSIFYLILNSQSSFTDLSKAVRCCSIGMMVTFCFVFVMKKIMMWSERMIGDNWTNQLYLLATGLLAVFNAILVFWRAGLCAWSDVHNWEREVCGSNLCDWNACHSWLSWWNPVSSWTSQAHAVTYPACEKRRKCWRHVQPYRWQVRWLTASLRRWRLNT